MTRRPPVLCRLTFAALTDAARVMVALGQWFILDPSLCRIMDHLDHTIATPEVVNVCVRCGRVEPA